LQSGSISISHVQTGGYIVNFGDDVSHRMILASSALLNDSNFRGQVIASSCVNYAAFCTAYGATSLPNTVAVFTTAVGDDVQEDHSFYVSVVAPNSSGAGSSVSTPRGPLGK
jgi:hypothetical protein